MAIDDTQSSSEPLPQAEKEGRTFPSNVEIAAISHVIETCERAYSQAEHDELRSQGCLPEDERRKAWFPALVNIMVEAHAITCRIRTLVKSPIEELFLAAVWAKPVPMGGVIAILRDGNMLASRIARAEPGAEDVWLSIEPQAPVDKYSADFLFTLRPMWVQSNVESRLVVELDGHDFHEKTRKQAEHDKKRDRHFVRQGLTVIRFTGSEVNRDAAACAGEALTMLLNLPRQPAEGAR